MSQSRTLARLCFAKEALLVVVCSLSLFGHFRSCFWVPTDSNSQANRKMTQNLLRAFCKLTRRGRSYLSKCPFQRERKRKFGRRGSVLRGVPPNMDEKLLPTDVTSVSLVTCECECVSENE